MPDPVRLLDWTASGDRADPPEWLVANGLGGYACGTVTGLITRRYHGLLMAALPVPLGRTMMLDGVNETVRLPDGGAFRLGAGPVTDAGAVPEGDHLKDFRLRLGLPHWRFAAGGIIVGRRLVLLHRQNTVLLIWRLLAGADTVGLTLRPFLHVRPSDGRVGDPDGRTYRVLSQGDRHEIDAGSDLPTLKLLLRGETPTLKLDGGSRQEIFYGWEAKRGYDSRGGVWSPGAFQVSLGRGQDVVLTASTESWETATALLPAEALSQELTRRRGLIEAAHPALHQVPANELVIAADSFVIAPPRHD
ncbi:MAG TPA: glycogen debranching enzyme N-terminal domain-containing protein, partial [Rhodospirillales bacterium]|nr:glycogen debranching enzyme N-terminal domain-containing protein [Rhodospirillales bacterium]